MAYPFVEAAHYSKGYKARKAIVIHMAEGGGTVEWLRNPNNPNVSAHYVVQYSGRVVQMVSEKNTAWGANPKLLRTNNDSAFTYLGESVRYGYTAAKAALGAYWYDPNNATITIEVEGYAASGPNSAQRGSLRKLVADIRSRWGNLPVLGHRDLQNYKPCPGKKIPWVDYGGHAVVAASAPKKEEEFVLNFHPMNGGDGVVKIKADRGLVSIVTGKAVIPDDKIKNSYARLRLIQPFREGEGWQDGYLVRHEQQAYIAFDAVVEEFTPGPTIAQSTIDAAVKTATDPLKAQIATLQAEVAALKAKVAEVTKARDAALAAKEAAEAAAASAIKLKEAIKELLSA